MSVQPVLDQVVETRGWTMSAVVARMSPTWWANLTISR